MVSCATPMTTLTCGYLIEHNYIKRDNPSQATVQAVLEAEKQLRRYSAAADERLAQAYPSVRFTGLAVVFHGWEMVSCQATAP